MAKAKSGGGHVTEEEYAEMLSFEDIFEMVIRPRLMSLVVSGRL